MVLDTYKYRCAVCNDSFDNSVGYQPALEAAHIRWRSDQGANAPDNGLSLCESHSELFNWGIFTVRPDIFTIEIAQAVL